MQAQVAAYPLDVRERLELSYAYRLAGDSMNALKELQAALALSPKKEQMWIETGTVLWQSGDVRGAQKAFNTAYALGPQFSDLATYAAAGDIAAGDSATADTILRKVYGTTTIDSDILAIAYYHAKNWERLLDIWELRASRPTAGAQALFGLAAAQYASGDGSGAIRTLRGAVMRHPEAKASADAAIAQIQENVPLR
jgi:Flp pilus assembly protein TadD